MLIRTKIVLSCVSSVVLAASAMLVALKSQQSNLSAKIAEEADNSAQVEASSIVSGVYRMVHAQNQLLQQKVQSDLRVAGKVLSGEGGVRLAEDATTSWTAINQFSKQSTDIALPTMMIGETPIVVNKSFSTEQPLVDEVQRLVGGTTTVFQRMNEAGDMLRVATNVQKTDGQRAVGTYIPAINPDGTPNGVISSVMRGETFYGRAFVVNAWYITAYEPMRDAEGEIIGVLYAGVKQESVASLREGILATGVGDTGNVIVFGGSGSSQGQLVISETGSRDGEEALEATDAEGNLFVQKLIASAKQAGEGQVSFTTYPWEVGSEGDARTKIAASVYYEPWDWVITAETFEDEFQKNVASMRAAATSMIFTVVSIAGVSCLVSTALIFLLAKRFTKPLQIMTATLRDLSEGDGDLTQRVTVDTRDEVADLAERFNCFVDKIHDLISDVRFAADEVADTARSIDEATQEVTLAADEQSAQTANIASAVEEMSASVIDIAKQSTEASEQADSSGREAEQGAEIVNQTIDGMRSIAAVVTESAASVEQLGERTQEIGEIIAVINDIADQTNLLALNAAIEAARAGEHGRGFAVVADEVRKLADRTTEATDGINKSIRTIQEDTLAVVNQMRSGTERVESGVELASSAGAALGSIKSVVRNVSGAIQSIAAAGEQQSVTSSAIASSIEKLSKSAQQAVESTGQTSRSVGTLSDRASHLQALVSRFKLHDARK